MYDRFDRIINYLRISVTDRCNLRCVYCMPAEGIQLLRHEDILGFERITEIARVAVRMGIRKIRLTGGEPLVRKGVADLVGMLRAIPGLETLAMTTNGTLLAPIASLLRERGLDSVNISLDTLDPVRYSELTRGGRLKDALDGIDAARKAGFPVKINTVVMESSPPGTLEELRSFCDNVGARLQRIREYDLSSTKIDDLRYDRPLPCSLCNRIRLLANGALKPCLHSDLEIPVDFLDIEGSIRACVRAKPLRGAACTTLAVGQIGG